MSDQLQLFDSPEFEDFATPDEITTHDGLTVRIYRPQPHHFQMWLRAVDEHLLDTTGYSVHQFAVVPTFGGWHEWPNDPCDAALAVLRQDVWGQAFLGDLDLE